MATEEPALTMKEAVMEVRGDVKAILAVLPLKSDRSDIILLERRVEALETNAAKAEELKALTAQVSTLAQRQASEDAVSSFKKWIVGLGVTVILTLLGLVGSIVIKLLPLGKHP